MGVSVWFSSSVVVGDSVIEVTLVTVSVTIASVAVSSVFGILVVASLIGESELPASFCGDTIISDTGSLMIVSVTVPFSSPYYWVWYILSGHTPPPHHNTGTGYRGQRWAHPRHQSKQCHCSSIQ